MSMQVVCDRCGTSIDDEYVHVCVAFRDKDGNEWNYYGDDLCQKCHADFEKFMSMERTEVVE